MIVCFIHLSPSIYTKSTNITWWKLLWSRISEKKHDITIIDGRASVAHLSGRLGYWISERFHLILSALLKDSHNVTCFSRNDSCVPMIYKRQTDCSIIRVPGLVEAIKSPWFLWWMFKKRNFALVAPDYQDCIRVMFFRCRGHLGFAQTPHIAT